MFKTFNCLNIQIVMFENEMKRGTYLNCNL